MSGGALGLVVLGYIGDNAKAAICLYVFVVAIGCCTNVGFNINHLDLAPNYAGILMGFTNAVASIGGVLAPTVCGIIVQDQVSILLSTCPLIVNSSNFADSAVVVVSETDLNFKRDIVVVFFLFCLLQTSVDEWRTVFILGAAILFFSSIFYIVFGSAEVQSWNEPQNENGKNRYYC